MSLSLQISRVYSLKIKQKTFREREGVYTHSPREKQMERVIAFIIDDSQVLFPIPHKAWLQFLFLAFNIWPVSFA